MRMKKSARLQTYPSIDSHSKIIINKPGQDVFTVRQHDVSNATRYIENMPKDVYNEPLTTVEELKKALKSSDDNETDDNANSTSDANQTSNATTDAGAASTV